MKRKTVRVIKILRLLQGSTQFEVALATGIPNYRISLLENGLVEPRRRELRRLAKALNIAGDMLTKNLAKEEIVQSLGRIHEREEAQPCG